MTAYLYGLLYFCAAACLAGCAARAFRYARLPAHLRWELYPVPHEDPEHARHGGSRYESADWWTRPTHVHHWPELRVMAAEILFLKALYEHNRGLWLRSFPFHFGLYLSILAGVLALLAAALPAGERLHPVYAGAGVAGAALVFAGALGLFVKRLTDPALKPYNKPSDLANLLFFLAAAGTGLAAWTVSPGIVRVLGGMLRFDTSLAVPPLTAAALALCALLAAYIPLTHMSHFIAKYFLYHSIRWDDRQTDAALRRSVAGYLSLRPTWSASHIGADGQKNWVDLATSNPPREVKK